MSYFFKPTLDLDGISKKLRDAARSHACEITAELQKATHEKIRGHYHDSLEAKSAQERYWMEVTNAHQRALIAEVSEEIELFAVELIMRKAAEWGQAAKAGED